MMLLYKRYIIKNILPSLMIIIFSITSIVWITQILRYLYLIDKGIKVSGFFHLISLIIPSLLFTLLPFATVFAILYTYLNLSERRHIIILQNIGLDNIRLAMPALIISLVITLFSYYISANLLPLSYKKFKSTLVVMKNNYISNMLEEKTFNKVSNDLTVYFDNKLPNGFMENLLIFDNHIPDKQTILFAKYGTLKIHNNYYILQLQKGTRQAHDTNGNLTNLAFGSLTLELQANMQPFLEKGNRASNEYYINELLTPSPKLSTDKKIKFISEGHQRLIWPLYNFLLVFLSLAVFLRQPYSKKSHLKAILITVFFIIIITYIHFTLHNLASKNLIYIFGCYGNIVIFTLFSIYLYFRKTI